MLPVLLAAVLASAVVWSPVPAPGAEPYAARWVHIRLNCLLPEQVRDACRIIEQAAGLGLNGVVVADAKFGAVELMDLDAPASKYRQNLEHLLAVCRRRGLEVVPRIPALSGGGGSLLHMYDPHLASGYEVRDAVFEIQGGLGRPVPDPQTVVVNGGFEEAGERGVPGWPVMDAPGRAVRIDDQTARTGRCSLRLEAAEGGQHGHCRASQFLEVRPRRCYRLSAWVRTAGLEPASSFRLYVRRESPAQSGDLAYADLDTAATQTWKRIETVFNTLNCDKVRIHVGLWGGKAGTAWVDDVELAAMPPVNVLRRPGCPVRLTSQDGQTVYAEGIDYQRLEDPQLGRAGGPGVYGWDHEPAQLRMRLPVPDGTRLLLSYYHPLIPWGWQVDCCMSEEKVYELFESNLVRFDRLVGSPRRYFLSYSEHRTGGGCAMCRASGKTPGQLMADSVRRCVSIIRKVRPGAEVIVWHDMFDPASNAVENYYLFEGSLAGSWEGLDRDVVVCVWDYAKRDASLAFFAKQGHRLLASMDFDTRLSPAEFVQGWRTSLAAVDGVQGAMYTTWSWKYGRMALFSGWWNAGEAALTPHR